MGKIDNAVHEVKRLVKKYKTRNPYELCDAMDIMIRYKDTGPQIKAYFIVMARIKSIVLNSCICDAVQKILVAHELGHAVLHEELALHNGFQELDMFGTASSAEYEANLFAAELLIKDDELLELLNDETMSFFAMAQELCIPVEMLDFKFRVLKNKGYHIEPQLFLQPNFLKNDIEGMYDDDWSGG
ncbi:hypothetical protein FACS1894105_03800 [Clostridia bacterium]|nr:hypothetical protein FACS1894105_03800 [Clostridia bacterium]